MSNLFKDIISKLLVAVISVNTAGFGLMAGRSTGVLLTGFWFSGYSFAQTIDELIENGDGASWQQAGELVGSEVLGGAPAPSSDTPGEYNLQMGGETQTINNDGLFGPSTSGHDFNGDGNYGDDSALGTSVNDLQTELESSSNLDGEAYRSVNDILMTAPISLANDPIWSEGDTILEEVESNDSDSQFYESCSTNTFTIDRTETITEYVEETCRDMKEISSSCRVTRLPVRTTIGYLGEGRIGHCGDGCNRIEIEHIPQVILDATECASNPTGRKQILFRAGLIPDGEAIQIESAIIQNVTASSAITITANGTVIYSNPDPSSGCGGTSFLGPVDVTTELQAVMSIDRTIDFIVESNTGDSPTVVMDVTFEGEWRGSDRITQQPLNCLSETGFPDEDLEETGFCRADSWTCNSEDHIEPVNVVERSLNTVPITVHLSDRDNDGDNRWCNIDVRNLNTGQSDTFSLQFCNGDSPLGYCSVQEPRCDEIFNYLIVNPEPVGSTSFGGHYAGWVEKFAAIGIDISLWSGRPYSEDSPLDVNIGDCGGWCTTPQGRVFNIDPDYDPNNLVVPWNHLRLYPGDDNDPICLQADANNYTCNPFGSDPVCLGQGDEQQCGTYDELFNGGDSCQVYKDDPNCGILSSEPDEDFLDPVTNEYYSFTSVYSCGIEHVLPGEDTVEEETCLSDLNCVSGECFTRAEELNADFSTAAGQLSVANFIKQENTCAGEEFGTATDCKIFDGREETCREGSALGVDCCEDPTGASTLSYISGAYQIMSAANDHGALDFMQPAVDSTYETMSGAWDTVVDNTTEVWDVVSEGFSSAFDNMVGTTATEVTTSTAVNAGVDVGGELITEVTTENTDLVSTGIGESISAFKNQVLETTHTFLNEQLGGLGDVFIQKTTENGVTTFGASALLSTIMFAYMIYNLANLAISLIYSCEDEEFLMAAQKEQGMCYKTGKSCAEEWLGKCVIDRHEYCCFDSPIARIIQQQGKSQFAMAGDDCSGFTMDQLGTMDWDQIDFTEWVDLLKLAGTIPTSRTISIDTLSGSNDNLDGGDRQSVTERTENRLNEIDIEETRNQLSDNLR